MVNDHRKGENAAAGMRCLLPEIRDSPTLEANPCNQNLAREFGKLANCE
jgi:hypothetical protein